jgi:biopolymer transport protein ExbB/TolQ
MRRGVDYKNIGCPTTFLTILLLPLTIFFMLIASFLGYVPFQVEIHTIVIIGIIFMIFLFFIPHNASYSACKVSKGFEQMEEELQEALKQNALTIMDRTKSTLKVLDFLEDYLKDIRDDNFAKVASSIFPMLGILGTFIAIAISMPDFTVTSSQKLDKEISILLSGVGTAFYASIYGIFLSLLWTFFEKRGQSKIDKIVIDLERIYSNHIWQKSELIKHQHMQTELRDKEIILALKEAFDINYIKELHNQYLKSFENITEQTNRNLRLLTEKMQLITADLRRTVVSIEDKRDTVMAEAHLKENLKEFVEVSKSLNKNLEKFDDSLDKSLKKVDYELAKAIDKLADMTELIALENHKFKKDRLFDDYQRKE